MKNNIATLLVILTTIFSTGCIRVATTKTPVSQINNNMMAENTITTETEKSPTKTIKKTWYQPKPGVSWQWQLNKKINTKYAVDIYDIDLFDTPKETIKSLQQKGIKVICYFSAGSYEDWRDDAKKFPKEILGKTLEGWENEKWLDISKINLLTPILTARLDLAVTKGCDGVEPDNVDGYLNESGFALTYNDQLKFNKWLADEAHKRNLAIGLKNDLDQISELIENFDFAVNEQCFEYNECEKLLPFTAQNKAVLGVEYELTSEKFCEKANDWHFSWLKMEYDLDGGRIPCN